MSHSILTVVGKDRIGIVYDVSKLLADHRINIVNISQQLMDDMFTMMIRVDMAQCTHSHEEMAQIFAREGEKNALDLRLQHEDLFQAMHRI